MKCLRIILKLYRLWNALCKKKYRERDFDFENIMQVNQLLLNRDFYRFLVFKDCLQRHARKWDQLCKLAQDFWQKKNITDHNWCKNKMSSTVKSVKKTVINFFALKQVLSQHLWHTLLWRFWSIPQKMYFQNIHLNMKTSIKLRINKCHQKKFSLEEYIF